MPNDSFRADPAPPDEPGDDIDERLRQTIKGLQIKPVGEMKGIQETLDIIQALNALLVKAAEEVSDGLDIKDALDIAMDDEVRGTIADAVRGADDVPAELADLSNEELRQLMHALVDGGFDVYDGVRIFVDASKKQ